MWLPPSKLAKISKKDYASQVETLRIRLLQLQFELHKADFPVLVVFGGVDGGGKHETVNLLNEWLDPRFLRTLAYSEPTTEERERPRMWRFWRDLPVRGQIGLVLSGWYSQPLLDMAKHHSDQQRFEHELQQLRTFERMLSDDGALILKFWMHLSARQQQARLQKLAEDPQTIWQVKLQDWEHLHLYERFIDASETMLEQTHSANAPWQVIDGSEPRSRHLRVAQTLADALERRLRQPPRVPGKRFRPSAKKQLDKVDLSARLEGPAYRKRLNKGQARLIRLHQRAQHTQRSTLLVFEGWDAAGKGGAIRRLVRPLDARQYRLIPIAAPTDEELARHYLWRFWRHLPRAGQLCVFDRSWYGRVLVERIEGFASAAQWGRAYAEINEFEQELVESGIRLLKFWLHLSPEEQLARFEARKLNPLKHWKLTEEDWRNRAKWDDYAQAVEDMLARTSTPQAPWEVIAGNNKQHARVAVIEAVGKAMLRY